MARYGQRQSATLGVIAGMLFTTIFHGGLIAGYLYWDRNQAEATPVEEPLELVEYEAVELLMWGEVMPEPGQLPTISNPAPEEAPQEVVELQEPEENTVVVREEPEERPRRREEPEEEEPRQDSSRHNPNRPVNSDPIQGSPDGFRGGTSLSPTALANLFGPAQAQIQRAFRPPGSISRDELGSLSARIRIYVNEAGRITRFSWDRRSGNDLFDSAAERAVNTFRLGSQRLRLPTANDQAMRQVLEHGLIIEIEP